MSAVFVQASTRALLNSASPITAVPFTYAVWINPANTLVQSVGGLYDTGTTNNYFQIIKATDWNMQANDGGSVATNAAGTVTVGAWQFLVMRCVTATNRWFSALNANGSTSHVQGTTSKTPTSIDTMTLGVSRTTVAFNEIDAMIGEFWCTKTDIQADGAQLKESLLWQLAYGGPFSIPHIAKDIIEYRSLRVHPDSRGDQIGEVYHGAAGRQTWTNISGVTTGPHPPLPYWYKRPGDSTRMLMA